MMKIITTATFADGDMNADWVKDQSERIYSAVLAIVGPALHSNAHGRVNFSVSIELMVQPNG